MTDDWKSSAPWKRQLRIKSPKSTHQDLSVGETQMFQPNIDIQPDSTHQARALTRDVNRTPEPHIVTICSQITDSYCI